MIVNCRDYLESGLPEKALRFFPFSDREDEDFALHSVFAEMSDSVARDRRCDINKCDRKREACRDIMQGIRRFPVHSSLPITFQSDREAMIDSRMKPRNSHPRNCKLAAVIGDGQ